MKSTGFFSEVKAAAAGLTKKLQATFHVAISGELKDTRIPASVSNLIDCVPSPYPVANLDPDGISSFGGCDFYIVNLH